MNNRYIIIIIIYSYVRVSVGNDSFLKGLLLLKSIDI